MTRQRPHLTPSVDKRFLLFLAGAVWVAVGCYLITRAWYWLAAAGHTETTGYAVAGAAAALLIHHFGFLKIVDKNLDRLQPMSDRTCVFAFMSWRSYLTVGVMIALGTLLRAAPIPRPLLSAVYIAIGMSLVLSSVRYMRVLIIQLRRQ